MNAPLNNAVRHALESVTLDDKQQCGLRHTYNVDRAAGHRGFGIQLACQGGAQ